MVIEVEEFVSCTCYIKSASKQTYCPLKFYIKIFDKMLRDCSEELVIVIYIKLGLSVDIWPPESETVFVNEVKSILQAVRRA